MSPGCLVGTFESENTASYLFSKRTCAHRMIVRTILTNLDHNGTSLTKLSPKYESPSPRNINFVRYLVSDLFWCRVWTGFANFKMCFVVCARVRCHLSSAARAGHSKNFQRPLPPPSGMGFCFQVYPSPGGAGALCKIFKNSASQSWFLSFSTRHTKIVRLRRSKKVQAVQRSHHQVMKEDRTIFISAIPL